MDREYLITFRDVILGQDREITVRAASMIIERHFVVFVDAHNRISEVHHEAKILNVKRLV